jgi:hypothetical protein
VTEQDSAHGKFVTMSSVLSRHENGAQNGTGNVNLCLKPRNSPTGKKPAHGVETEELPQDTGAMDA